MGSATSVKKGDVVQVKGKDQKFTLVVVRHGQSQWNKDNLFTGWADPDLTEQGILEAKAGGRALKEKGYDFDIAYTSYLKRAVKTLFYVQDELDLHYISVHRHWRLNERHYGGLTGLNKKATAQKHGDEQVHIWRRSYDIPPPPIDEDSEHNSAKDRRYKDVDKKLIPKCECLKDTVERVLPYWNSEIAPKIKAGKRVLIAAHGNSLRALVKHLEKVSDKDIPGINIPTGIPLVYKLDGKLNVEEKFYLADEVFPSVKLDLP